MRMLVTLSAKLIALIGTYFKNCKNRLQDSFSFLKDNIGFMVIYFFSVNNEVDFKKGHIPLPATEFNYF